MEAIKHRKTLKDIVDKKRESNNEVRQRHGTILRAETKQSAGAIRYMG